MHTQEELNPMLKLAHEWLNDSDSGIRGMVKMLTEEARQEAYEKGRNDGERNVVRQLSRLESNEYPQEPKWADVRQLANSFLEVRAASAPKQT